MGEATRRVWTIGHSNYEPDEFLALLREASIDTVVDVRSTPFSAHASQFNRERIEAMCQAAGFAYRHEGAGFGGRPEGEAYYDEESHVLYGLLAQTPEFECAMERLLADVDRGARAALVCVEPQPHDCHRSWFLGRALAERGLEVVHIFRDGSQRTAEELEFERTGGQETLFMDEEEVWRSPMAVPRPSTTRIEDL